jgi:hypothetical protein
LKRKVEFMTAAAAARRRARGAGEGEFPRHARLRAHRGLRPGDDLRMGRGVDALPSNKRAQLKARQGCAMRPRMA